MDSSAPDDQMQPVSDIASSSASNSHSASEMCYSVVNNIPKPFRAKDLRYFFSGMIENGQFDCFHFQHRPERKQQREQELDSNIESKQKPLKTRCCLVRLTQSFREKLFSEYHGKRWFDKSRADAPLKCIITKVKIADVPNSNNDETGASLRESDLAEMPELRPPPLMPNGNVGTPTEHFLDLINSCRLPPKVVGKLGLDFKAVAKKRKRPFANMKLDYDGCLVVEFK